MKKLSATLIMIAAASMLHATISITPIVDCICEGNPQQAFEIVAEGTAGPFSFLLTGPNGYESTQQNPEDIQFPGTYTLLVTNAYGCTFSYESSIPACPLPELSPEIQPSCPGNNDGGSIDLTLDGGTEPFTFLWNTGATTQNLSGLSPGTYGVTVTDGSGCTVSLDGLLIDAYNDAVDPVGSSQPSCPGQATGSIDLNPEGGTAPYTFSWSNGADTEDINNLSAGVYEVTASDANGCSTVESYLIQEVSMPGIQVLKSFPTCAGINDGVIKLKFQPPGGNYQVLWNTGATTAAINNLAPGIYSPTITANGCVMNLPPNQANIALPEPDPIQLTFYPQMPSCPEAENGSLSVEVNNGEPPYQYAWNIGAGNIGPGIALIPAGTYSVTVTDFAGCVGSGEYVLEAGSTAIQLTAAITDLTCADGPDGAIALSATGGIEPYSYQWVSPTYPSFQASTASISGLSAGTYCVTVGDANGCPATACYEVELTETEPNFPYIESVEVSVSINGVQTPIYRGSWQEATPGCLSYVQDENITITDEAFNALQQNALLSVQAVCNKVLGAITLSLENTSFSQIGFSSNLMTWDFTITPSSQLIQNGAINSHLFFTGMDAEGQELLDLRAMSNDLSGCADFPELQNDCTWLPPVQVGTDDVHLLQRICSEMSQLSTSSSHSTTSGCDGTITLNIENMVAPYSITISGEEYTSTFESNAQTYNFTGLCIGTYSLSVTDANMCDQIIEQSVGFCSTFHANPAITHVTVCHGDDGSIVFGTGSITGGQAPYTFEWSTGDTGSSLTGIETGTYEVTITDASACSQSFSYTLSVINYDIGNSDFILNVVEINHDADNSCSGSITVHLYYSGSQNSVRLILNGPSGYQNILIPNPAFEVLDIDYTFDDLCAGEYTIIGRYGDPGFFCDIDINFEILSCPGFYIKGEPELIKPLGCMEENGSILFEESNIAGGTAPFLWMWSNGSNNPWGITNLAAGTYGLTIVDANGCMLEASYDLTIPFDAAQYEITSIQPPIAGCDGSIIIHAIPGSTISMFNSSIGLYSQIVPETGELTFVNLCPIIYKITVTDISGCSSAEFVTLATCPIISPPAWNIHSPATCTSTDGFIGWFDSPSGGTPPYELTLETENGDVLIPGQNGRFEDLAEGDYTIIVKDANSCIAEFPITLSSDATPIFIYEFVKDECEDLANGAIYVAVNSASGGTFYTYEFTPQATGITQTTVDENVGIFDGLVTGYYHLKITNNQTQCSTDKTFFVDEIPSRGVFTLESYTFEKSCPFQNTGMASFYISGGTPPYYIRMNNNIYLTSEADPPSIAELSISNLTPGTYTVNSITDDCDRVIPQANLPTFTIGTFPEMNLTENIQVCCPGLSKVSLSVNGGTAPYTYSWNIGSTESYIENLYAGIYSATVTDAKGCYQSETYTVNTIAPPTIVADETISVACDSYPGNKGKIGRIELNQISGGLTLPTSTPNCGFNVGIPPNYNNQYRVIWSTGSSASTINNLSTGNYRLTVTDGCGEYTRNFNISPGSIDDPAYFNTCYDIITCGGYEIDLDWTGYTVDISEVTNMTACEIKIKCNNGNMYVSQGNTTHDDFIGNPANCTCKERLHCNVNVSDEVNASYLDVNGMNHEESNFVQASAAGSIERDGQIVEIPLGLGESPCAEDELKVQKNCGTGSTADLNICRDCNDCLIGNIDASDANWNEDAGEFSICTAQVPCEINDGTQLFLLEGIVTYEYSNGVNEDYNCPELCFGGHYCQLTQYCDFGTEKVKLKESLSTATSVDYIDEEEDIPLACDLNGDNNIDPDTQLRHYYCGDSDTAFLDFCYLYEETLTSYICQADPIMTCDDFLAILESRTTNEAGITFSNYELVPAEQVGMRVSKVYPNPFQQELNIDLWLWQENEVHFSIFDVLGNIVCKSREEVSTGNNTITLNCAENMILNGIYFLKIADNAGHSYQQKVIYAPY
ncbi:MAG TPA: T9SS type A sorting domain-containing protein [Saprospiraceae bacterium]|nr:T9SS type A sorting domain-containing protein [Saprospiraceae bacterium]HMQ85579.1 T9SS type A sorting domain-containing protein [Saprospiraceae bacterium]